MNMSHRYRVCLECGLEECPHEGNCPRCYERSLSEIDPKEVWYIPVHKDMHFGHVLGSILSKAFPDLSHDLFTNYTFSVNFDCGVELMGNPDVRIYRFYNFILKK